MKKLSLVLALVLVLTCAVLAACGGDEDTSSAATSSTAATSKEESKTESKAESKEEAVSSEAPAESSEEAPAESSEEAPAEITGENIAPDATYTYSQLYKQGGADVEWGWDDTAAVTYDDEGGVTLNDGLFASELGFDAATVPEWAGFHAKAPDYATTGYHWVTFDLGEAKDITGARVYVGTADLGGGIAAPNSIEVFVSADGNEWTSVGSAIPANVTTEDGTGTECVEIAGAGNGQYVQIRLIGEAWCFVSEIEIYG